MKIATRVPSRIEAGLPALLLASWFGCGLAPVAPGTVGSAAGLAVGILLVSWAGGPPWRLAVLAAAMTPVAVWAAGKVAQAQAKRDPGLVVVDEVLGQWIAMAGAARVNWRSVAAAFLLFRVFDIVKPVPVRQAESLPGGAGIVADDLAAGLYAAFVLWLAGCFNFY